MTEENVKDLIEAVKESAYVPGDWFGVSDMKVVRLEDVLTLIDRFKG